FLLLREKEDVEAPGDEHDRDADTDVRADGRSFLAGDSAAVHRIAFQLYSIRNCPRPSRRRNHRQFPQIDCAQTRKMVVATPLWDVRISRMALLYGAVLRAYSRVQ